LRLLPYIIAHKIGLKQFVVTNSFWIRFLDSLYSVTVSKIVAFVNKIQIKKQISSIWYLHSNPDVV